MNSSDNIEIFNYTWTFTYNNHTVSLYGGTPSFVFNIPGNYSITMIITDTCGNTATDSIQLCVNKTSKEEPIIDDDDDDDDDNDDDDNDDNNSTTGKGSSTSSKISLSLILPILIIVLIIIAYIGMLIVKRRKYQKMASFPEKTSETEGEITAATHIPEIEAEIESIPLIQRRHLMDSIRYKLPNERPHQAHQPVLVTQEIPNLKITGETQDEVKALPPAPEGSIENKTESDMDTITDETTIPESNPSGDNIPLLDEPSLPIASLPPPPDISKKGVPQEDSMEKTHTESLISELFPDMTDNIPPKTPSSEPLPPNEVDPEYSDKPHIPEERKTLTLSRSRKKRVNLSYLSIKNTMLFKLEDAMPCSICFGDITEGLQAVRCSCGNICHLSCAIRIGKCTECDVDYQKLLNQASEEAILESIEDSQKTAKKELEDIIDWDEKDDLVRQLLKQVINKEISITEYKLLVKDVKRAF